MMIRRVASVLLIGALVSVGSVPFAHARVNRRVLRQRVEIGALADEQNRAYLSGAIVGDQRRHLSVAAVSIAGPSVRVDAAPAVVEVWAVGVVGPDLQSRPVPPAAHTRPTRLPRILLAARAPPA